jgi:hypothetical protein
LLAQAVLPGHPVLGQTLARLAANYDYPAILQILSEDGGQG